MARRKKRGRFRSKSEEDVYNSLTDLGVPIRYEEERIKYTWLEYKTYTPDFILPNNVILEVKGRFVLEDRKKHLFIRTQKPEIDIRFIFDNPNSKLYKNGKMTYATWCIKHKFLFCKRKDGIPIAWINEKKSRRKAKENI